jgi:hypothetical protein
VTEPLFDLGEVLANSHNVLGDLLGVVVPDQVALTRPSGESQEHGQKPE